MTKEIGRFLRHSSVYALGNIANRIGAFILLPLYTNFLTTSEYGMLEIFYSINTIIASLLGFGLAHATLRFFFEDEDEKEGRKFVSTSIISSFAISVAGTAIALLFRGRLSLALFDSADYANLFYLCFGIVIVEISTQIHFAYLRAKEHSGIYVVATMGTMVLQVGCNIVTVAKLKMGVQGILTGNFIATGMTWLVLTIYVLHKCTVTFDMKKFREMFFYTYPLLLGIIVSAVLTNVDRFILKSLDSMESVGVYTLAVKMSAVIGVVLLDPFKKNFGPYRFSIMKQDNAGEIYSRITSYMMYAVIFTALGLSVFISDVLKWMSKPEFWDAAQLVPIVCLGVVLGSLTYPFQTQMLIGKKTKNLFFITILTGVLALLLNFALIPRFAAYGCAVARIIALVVECGITFVISHRIFKIRYDFLGWAKALSMGVIFYLVASMIQQSSYFIALALKSLLMIAFPFGLFAMGCFSREEVEALRDSLSLVIGKTRTFLGTTKAP